MKFLRNELEKHIKIKLPMSKLDSFFYVELISQSNQVFIGKKNNYNTFTTQPKEEIKLLPEVFIEKNPGNATGSI